MRIGVWTSDRVLAEDTITKVEKTLGDIVVRKNSYSNLFTQDDQGNVVMWVRPSENARGYKFDNKKIFIGRFNSKEDAIAARLDAEIHLFGEFSPQKIGGIYEAD